MKRLSTQPSSLLDLVPQEVQAGVFQTTLERPAEPTGLAHTLFFPLHYEKNYAYPLLVWLHGGSDDESQLKRIMPLISLRNYGAIAPRGNCQEESIGDGPNCYRWQQTDGDVAEAASRVRECVEIARRQINVHAQRIFLAGYGCGGTMALRLGMLMPELFAGALSIGAGLPRNNAPLKNVHRARNLPLFVVHGRSSRKYPTSRVCEDLRLVHSAGMALTLRQYPCGDELTSQMLSDMDAWIMEHVTGQASTSDDESISQQPGEWN